MLPSDPLRKVLHVDLTRKSFRVEHRPELFEERLGGAGVAIALLDEVCPTGADPLGPDNPIVLAVGALTAHFPLCSKTVAMFKSPLTGDLGESHCGGRSAVALRMAGYGAVVITGASDLPVYLSIDGSGVKFRDASVLWEMKSVGPVGRVIRENEGGAGCRSIMRIGRAGERLVRYACVTTETFRHFGRLGLGAVFGSKHLKAIVVNGKRSLPVADMGAFRKVYQEIYDAAVSSKAMKKYHDLGTPQNVKPLNELGALPTRNLQSAVFEGASTISGEHFAANYLGRRLACTGCPTACIHVAALREAYEDEAYFYKTTMISYDHELIYALGSMLGMANPEHVLKLLDEVEEWGLDAMSTGVCLAWATEALQKGIIGSGETSGLALAFGQLEPYLAAMAHIVNQPNDFWRDLARGVEHAAAVYGGADYALAFGGNEMPGYHTGPGCHLGWSLSARHSHLCNAGYSLDQKMVADDAIPRDPEAMADALVKEECWRQILSSMVLCFFARGIYTPELVTRCLDAVGWKLGPTELTALGERIYREKYRFKLREGFDFGKLRLPGRIFETASPFGPFDEAFMRRAIERVRAFHVEPTA